MTRRKWLLSVGCSSLLLLAGCQSPPPKEPEVSDKTKPALPSRTVRSNCYSLLYGLLSKQRNVSKVLIIKKEQPALKELIKRIADTSGRGADLVSSFAKEDPGISLEMELLPPGETATREAIEKTKTGLLLHSSGRDFEAALLLTQAESMNYAWHLCHVTAAYEPSAERARELKSLGQEFRLLHHEAFNLLRAGAR